MAESSEQTRGQALGPPWSALLGLRAWSTSRDRLKALLGVGADPSPDPGLAGLSAQPLAPAALVLIAPSLDGGLCHSLGVSVWMGLEAFTNRPCPDFPLNFVKVIFSL